MITMSDVTFAYSKKAPLFTELSLTLEPGNIYGLLGRNGAGKTTLLKMISGLRRPHSGSVTVEGVNPARRSFATNSEICFIPEEIFVPTMKPSDFVKSYGALYPRFSKAQYAELSEMFEIPESTRLGTLSMGEKKKFLLAFGVATGARLLILDEPTNGLDIPAKKMFRQVVARLADEERLVIISTHQVRDVESLIDPVIIIDGGRVLLNATLEEVGMTLHHSREKSPPTGEDLLWSQEVLGGYEVVRINRSGSESAMDLETLFIALTADRAKTTALFSKGGAR